MRQGRQPADQNKQILKNFKRQNDFFGVSANKKINQKNPVTFDKEQLNFKYELSYYLVTM